MGTEQFKEKFFVNFKSVALQQSGGSESRERGREQIEQVAID